MAIDTGSMWSPLPESGRQGTGHKNKFVVHSTGDNGTAAAVYKYFSRADVVVESTFIIGKTPADPTRQILKSDEVADANLGANITAIAVEVVGTADEPFTDWQVSELIRLGVWAHNVHGIPYQVCPSADGAGYGWHVMFGSPGPWTPVAKACPGKTRIAQLKATVFPHIFGGEEDDMFSDADRIVLNDTLAELRSRVGALQYGLVPPGGYGAEGELALALRSLGSPDAIAAKVIANLPAGSKAVSKDDLVAALTVVLGSVDNK